MLEQTRNRLESLYAGEPQQGTGGLFDLDARTKVSREQGRYLATLHRRTRPALSIEIGLAYGFSTLHILDAMHEDGYGRHIAIDPFQSTEWHDIALVAIAELGFSGRFRHIPDFSFAALADLYRAKERADFVFIDGNHNFDAALLDLHCSNRLLTVGGYIILDDMWMPSIRKVAAFTDANLLNYQRIPSPVPNVLVLQKTGEDLRDWRHFVEF